MGLGVVQSRDQDQIIRAEINQLIDEFNSQENTHATFKKLAEWAIHNDEYLRKEESASDMIDASIGMMIKIIEAQFSRTIGLIDVGSAGGLSSPWGEFKNTIGYFVGFEPNDTPAILENGQIMNCGVWECDETRPFYIQHDSRGSSLFLSNEEFVRNNFEALDKRGGSRYNESWFKRSKVIETKQIACRSLDSLMENELQGHTFDFIKIDAQGAEYNILKGAERFLETDCVGLLLELFHVPLYRGITLAREAIEYLEKRGFYLAYKYSDFGSFNANSDYLFLHRDRNPDVSSAIHKIYQTALFMRRFKYEPN